jgi:putative Mg2+ transporter-C (MgtC) family protein
MFEGSEIFIQGALAVTLGGLIGLEREYKKKAAGIRTYALTCLGSMFFTYLAFEFYRLFASEPNVSFDFVRVIQSIAIGVGFIAGGLIILRDDNHLVGLTTATGLWVAAGIGVAIGAGLYMPATFIAFLTLLVLRGAWIMEKYLMNKKK